MYEKQAFVHNFVSFYLHFCKQKKQLILYTTVTEKTPPLIKLFFSISLLFIPLETPTAINAVGVFFLFSPEGNYGSPSAYRPDNSGGVHDGQYCRGIHN